VTSDPFAMAGRIPGPAATEHHNLPLPPELREFRPSYDGYGRYLLPDPETKGTTPFTRVTTGAKTLDDTSKLEAWKIRSVTQGFRLHPELLDDIDLLAPDDQIKKDLERASERAHVAAGGQWASEFGTAIHAWLEAVEGLKVTMADVPPEFVPFCLAYGKALAEYGICSAEGMIERIVYNSMTGWVGTFDRIYVLGDGSLCIGDVKTAKDLQWAWLAIAVQLCDYAEADLILSLDGTAWEPMPEVRQDFAVVAHVPSNADPARASLVPINLAAGREATAASLHVRQMRSEARKAVPLPVSVLPRKQLHSLRALVQTCTSREQLVQTYEAYSAHWTPELTELGNQILARRQA